MYIDETLRCYLDDLASSRPTPGGGSTAALCGAMAAALASMVCRLTLGKEAYASVQDEIESLLSQAEQLRARFQVLVQEDIEAYGRLSTSFKLPRNTAEEKQARTLAIQEQLVEAALVPLEMAERAATLARLCSRVAEIGNSHVLSDIAVSAKLAATAAEGASWMVTANVQMLKDAELAAALQKRLDEALFVVAELTPRTVELVGRRV